jgi:hypothetical protein
MYYFHVHVCSHASAWVGTECLARGRLTTNFSGNLNANLNADADLYFAAPSYVFGVNNFMTYVAGDIPIGRYHSARLANLGLGHSAIDAGGGYTYFNPQTG